MMRSLLCILAVGVLVCPTFGQPLTFSDALTTAATYDSNSYFVGIYGGPRTKYTCIEAVAVPCALSWPA